MKFWKIMASDFGSLALATVLFSAHPIAHAQALPSGISRLWTIPFFTDPLNGVISDSVMGYGLDGSALVSRVDSTNLLWITATGNILLTPLNRHTFLTGYWIATPSSIIVSTNAVQGGGGGSPNTWILLTRSPNNVVTTSQLGITGGFLPYVSQVNPLSLAGALPANVIPIYDNVGRTLSLYSLNPISLGTSSAPQLALSLGASLNLSIDLPSTSPITVRTSTNLVDWTSLTNFTAPALHQTLSLPRTTAPKVFFSVEQN